MRHFVRGELTFDVRDEGPPDGEPVVLLHGFPQNPSCWDRVAPLLHAAGLRTLAPWQRGYSPGARPRGRRAYRLSECALDVIAMLDQAGLDQAHVVGHDWGGAVVWQLGGRHPSRIRSVTAVSTPHPSALLGAMPRGQALRSWYMGVFQLPRLPELIPEKAMARILVRSGLTEEQAQNYAENLAGTGGLGPAINWYRALPWSAREGAGRCRVPTTYVWGRKDFALGRRAAEATRGFVAAPYRFVDLDAGHWLPESRPAQLADVVLERVRAALPN